MIILKLHIACIWLALQVAISSVGVPLIEHYCTMSGQAHTSVWKEDNCCSQKKAPLQSICDVEEGNQDDDCCQKENSYEALDLAVFDKYKVKIDSFELDDFLLQNSIISFIQSFSQKEVHLFFTDLPPPFIRSGQFLLLLFQVFRL